MAGGRDAAKREKRSEDGEDRLSALPDDLLLEILLRLGCTYKAARTSILAPRWRNLWRSLPEVRLKDHVPDGYRIRDLLRLDAPAGLEAPELRCISVTGKACASPDSVTAWLPAAARRLVGSLVYEHTNDGDQEGIQLGDQEGIQLPLFDKATNIMITLGFVNLSLPLHGIFALLRELSFSTVVFRGPCDVGSCVSTSRCPRLHTLHFELSRGFKYLRINSKSLLKLKLYGLHRLERLTIESESLQELAIEKCFPDAPTDLIADISAPQLCSLDWVDVNDPRFIRLGKLGRLGLLRIGLISHGDQRDRVLNQHSLKILRLSRDLQCLRIRLLHPPVGNQYSYILEDLTAMPPITMLELVVHATGHGCGATIFHLLQMWSALRRFELQVVTTLSGESECTSGCNYDDSVGWKDEELKLTHLEEIHIVMHGYEHEVAFLQRLLHCSSALKRFRMKLKSPNSNHRIKEVREAVKAFFSPEVYSEFDTSDDEG